MHFDRNPFMCSCEDEKRPHNDFKSCTFIGRFPGDTLASMAVKGLIMAFEFPVFVQ